MFGCAVNISAGYRILRIVDGNCFPAQFATAIVNISQITASKKCALSNISERLRQIDILQTVIICERSLCNRRQSFRHSDFTQTDTATERILSNCPQSTIEVDSPQRDAASKCIRFQNRHSLRDSDAFQRLTSVKCTASNFRHTFRKHNVIKRHTITEYITSNGCHISLHFYRRQSRTPSESGIFDLLNIFRESNGVQSRTSIKRT